MVETAKKRKREIGELAREMEERRSRASMLEGRKKDLLERGEQLSRELEFEEQKSAGAGLGFQDFEERVKELEGNEKGVPAGAGGKPVEGPLERALKEAPKKKSRPKPEPKPKHGKPEELRKKLEEQRSLIENLENEKLSLARIIEQISGQEAPKAPDEGIEGLRSAFEQRIRNLEDRIRPAGEGGRKEVENTEDKKAGGAPEGEARPEGKADSKKISGMIRKAVDTKFDEISEKLSGLDRIAALAESMSPAAKPAPPARPAAAGQEEPSVLGAMAQTYLPHAGMEGSSVSTGLASFGQEVNLHGELIELKKQIDLLKKNLDALSKKWDYSVGNLEERVRGLDKLPILERNYHELAEKLGSENVQRLKRLVFNADELTDEVIPDIINKKFRYRLDPVVTSLKNTRGAVKELSSRINVVRSEVKELTRLRESMNEFRLEKDRLYKRFAEEEARFLDGLHVLKENIKKKLDKMTEKINRDIQSLRQASDYATIESNVKDIVTVLFEKRFQELERNQTFFDQRAKGLSEDDIKLRRLIEEMEAPESIKRWAETRLQEIEKKITPDIENARKDITRHADSLNKLREGLRTAEKALNSFSKRTEEHAAAITKLINSKDLFFKRSDELAERMGVLEERVSGEGERLASLGSSVQAALKEHTGRIDKAEGLLSELGRRAEKGDAMLAGLRKETVQDARKEAEAVISSAQAALSRVESRVSGLGGEIMALKSLAEPVSKKAETHSSLLVKLMESSDTLDKRTGDLGKEVKDLNDRITSESDRISHAEQNLARSLSMEIADLRKAFNARLADFSKSSMKDLKGQTGRISVVEEGLKNKGAELGMLLKQIDSLRSSVSGLPAMDRRLGELEKKETDSARIIGKHISDEEFVSTVRGISARIDSVEKKTEDALKGLSEGSGRLREMIIQALGDDKVMRSAQEGMKGLLAERLGSLDSRLTAELRSLKQASGSAVAGVSSLKDKATTLEGSLEDLVKQQDRNQAAISRLTDTMQAVKALPQKFESQEKALAGLIEDRNSLAARADITASEVERLKETLSRDQQELTGMERKVQHSLEAGADSLRKDVESRISDILKSQLRGSEAETRRILETEKELKSFIAAQRSSVDKLGRDVALLQRTPSEIERLDGRVSGLEASGKEFHEKTTHNQLLARKISDMENLAAAMQKRLSSVEEQARADRLNFQSAMRDYEKEKRELGQRLGRERSRLSELLKELRE